MNFDHGHAWSGLNGSINFSPHVWICLKCGFRLPMAFMPGIDNTPDPNRHFAFIRGQPHALNSRFKFNCDEYIVQNVLES